HHSEIVRTHARLIHEVAGWELPATFELEVSLHQERTEWHPVDRRRPEHSGQVGKLRQATLVKFLYLHGAAILGVRQVDRHGQDVLWTKARIDRTHPQETLQHQTGARQQHESKSDFQNHQSAAESFMPSR